MSKISLQDGELARWEITKEQENEISKLYHSVYLDLKKKMEPLSHDANVSQSIKKTYLNKLTKQLKASYQSIGIGLEKQIQKGMEETSSAVVTDVDAWIKKAGIKIEGCYSYVPRDIVSLVSSGKLYGSGWTLSKAIWGESQQKAHDIDQIVAGGIAANKSAYDIAKDLEKYVNPSAKKDWEWSKVYPGTSKKVDYNAQRLARTMVSHAYQQSLLATTKYNPFVIGYRWLSAHVERTCQLCEERSTQDDYGLGSGVFPKDELPLDHPNGMCTYEAVIPDNMIDIADRLADWAQGEDDPDLDQWYASFLGGTLEAKPTFTELQDKWLTPNGFSPDKMPQDFTEWSHTLTSEQKKELFDTLSLHGVDHPFQKMNVWYDQYVGVTPPNQLTFVPRQKTVSGSNLLTGAYSQQRKDAALWAKSSKEADKKLRGVCGDVWRTSTELQKDGAYHYTWGSGPFNTPLRSGGSWDYRGDYRGKIQGLTEMIDRSSYPFDVWLQRGVDHSGASSFLNIPSSALYGSEEDMKAKVLGAVFTDDAFLSTATSKGKGFDRDCIFNVYAPAGTKMIYAEPFSYYGNGDERNWDGVHQQSTFGPESEMILQRGGSYRITKVERSGSKWYFDMEVVGQDPLPEGKTHSK